MKRRSKLPHLKAAHFHGVPSLIGVSLIVWSAFEVSFALGLLVAGIAAIYLDQVLPRE